MHTKFESANQKARDNLECLGTDEKTILKWMFKEQYVSKWTLFIWLRIGSGDGLLWYGNEHSGSIIGG
jgi:hypothetical protein